MFLIARRFLNCGLIGLVSFLLFFFSVTPVSADVYHGGTGTSDDPYQILTCLELQSVQDNLSSNFVLVGNIDCTGTDSWNSGAGFVPIGDSGSAFTGNFDGAGYSISNVTIQKAGNYSGIFGYVSGSTISKVKLLNISVSSGNNYVGSLVGYMLLGSVTESTASGVINLTANSENVGGLIGYIDGAVSVSNSSSSVTLDSSSYIISGGGLVGIIKGDATITNSFSTGSITAGGSGGCDIGGLVGSMSGATNGETPIIDNSYATGSLHMGDDATREQGDYACSTGGFIGFLGTNTNNSFSSITNSYSTGDLTIDAQSNDIGGFVGLMYGNSTITDSHASGKIVSDSELVRAGGFAGSSQYANNSIKESYESGKVIAGYGSYNIGGFIGDVYSNTVIQIEDSYSSGDVVVGDINHLDTGLYSVGGFAGLIVGQATITLCHSSSNLTAYGMAYSLGGFVGKMDNSNASIQTSYSTGSINQLGYISYETGGFVGNFSSGSIEKCSSRGSYIKGYEQIGGFVGYGSGNGLIKNSYSKTNIIHYFPALYSSDQPSMGGFIGLIDGTTLENDYSIGSITPIPNKMTDINTTLSDEITLSDSTTVNVTNDEGVYADGYLVITESSASELVYVASSSATSLYVIRQMGNTTAAEYTSAAAVTNYIVSNPTTDIGGFTGTFTSGTITSSYWDKETSGLAISTDESSTGLASTEMQTQSSFTDWDFTDVWNMSSGVNGSYPYLSSDPEEIEDEPEPTPTPIPFLTSVDNVENNSSGPTKCMNSSPIGIPVLFQIDVMATSAKLYFTPLSNTSDFYISFSEDKNAERHGEYVSLIREGVLSHTVYHLKPNTLYYFKIRGQNGCMPGLWSNIMSIKTGKSGVNKSVIYYKGSNPNTYTSTVKPSPRINVVTQSTPPPQINVTPVPTPTVTDQRVEIPKKKCFLFWCWE